MSRRLMIAWSALVAFGVAQAAHDVEQGSDIGFSNHLRLIAPIPSPFCEEGTRVETHFVLEASRGLLHEGKDLRIEGELRCGVGIGHGFLPHAHHLLVHRRVSFGEELYLRLPAPRQIARGVGGRIALGHQRFGLFN